MTHIVMLSAATGNHIALVQYLSSINAPWHDDLPQYLSSINAPYHDDLPQAVSERGLFDMLKHVLDSGCPIRSADGQSADAGVLAYHAARGSHVTILEWLITEHGVNLSETRALAGASRGGHLSLMDRLMDQHGCEVTVKVCEDAVRHGNKTGNLQAAECLLQRGLFIRRPTLYVTALGRCHVTGAAYRYKVVRWLREVADCPWDAADVAEVCISNRQLDCLQYVHQHAGPFSAEQLTQQLDAAGSASCDRERMEVAQWLLSQGAAWPTQISARWSLPAKAWARTAGYTGDFS